MFTWLLALVGEVDLTKDNVDASPVLKEESTSSSGDPRAPKARARGAPLLRKYGNPSMREILVLQP